MKHSLVKLLLIIPALLFLDWIIMVLVGSVSNILGANDNFFCTIYCDFGIALLIETILFVVYIAINQNFHHKVQI
ncbi:MAG: hypothetical protein PHP53_10100 [Prolixibacteraceae bacterium]|nr:hypothetical protein [Prolixibacteraceae bacterium]